jgi:ATP phosphoribosyltransferase regulatory subunit
MLNNNDSEKIMLKLPFGFRDIFPTEARERKSIEDAIRKQFESWGYGEVRTPVVEYTENIAFGAGKEWKDKLISFFDVDGNLISMRADMTIPIARLTGMRIKRNQIPVRFYYFANSFRQSGIQKGKKRVFNQVGLEFIGTDSKTGDIEVLTILTEILIGLNISNFKVALSHTGFLDGVSSWFGLKEDESGFVRKSMISKNFVELKSFLGKKDKKRAEIFLKLIKPSGNFDILNDYKGKIENEIISGCFDYIAGVYENLKKLGFSEYFILDLGTAKDFGYYSGLFFDVFSPGIPEIIGSGGRYDGLIKNFGLDVAGTGFALDADLLHKSVGNFDKDTKAPERVIFTGPGSRIAELIKLSGKLREKGFRVELMPSELVDPAKIKADKNVDFLYHVDFDSGTIKIINLTDGSENMARIENL